MSVSTTARGLATFTFLAFAVTLIACSTSPDDGASESNAAATGKKAPGAACTEHDECSSKACFVKPNPPSCSATQGVCCAPAGTKPIGGDGRSCCNGDVRNGICCLGSGQWPDGKASLCCSGKTDGGYCTNAWPNGKPKGAPCQLNTDCASNSCPNDCGESMSGGSFCN